jgi:hypothetical protein
MIYIVLARNTKLLDIDNEEYFKPKNADELLYAYTANIDHFLSVLHKIDRMILLNFDDIRITSKDIKQHAINWYEGRSDEEKKQIVLNMKVFNATDLGIDKNQNIKYILTNGYSVENMNLNSLGV